MQAQSRVDGMNFKKASSFLPTKAPSTDTSLSRAMGDAGEKHDEETCPGSMQKLTRRCMRREEAGGMLLARLLPVACASITYGSNDVAQTRGVGKAQTRGVGKAQTHGVESTRHTKRSCHALEGQIDHVARQKPSLLELCESPSSTR
eukprot:6173086-Pleurochrysis_carterae.AAC.1